MSVLSSTHHSQLFSSQQTHWFPEDSPYAWIPQDLPTHSDIFRGDIVLPHQDYSPPTDLNELWFKLPSDATTSSLNWNDFVNIPSSAGMNAESLPFVVNDSADCYLDSHTFNWDHSPAATTPGSPLSSTIPNDTLKGESFSFPRLGGPRNIDIEAELSRQNLYKTELCRSWVESASCKYGNKCQFAHGQHELRPVIRHPKYKTEICKTFHTNGTCPYGKRCRFVHNPGELRMSLLGATSSNNNSAGNSNNTPNSHRLPGRSESLPAIIPENPEEDEELRQLQEKFKLSNLAPDPVFASQSFPASLMPTSDSSPSVPLKKGSSLPFFQKLRKQKF